MCKMKDTNFGKDVFTAQAECTQAYKRVCVWGGGGDRERSHLEALIYPLNVRVGW